ncbi:cytochrome P450 [Armillaria borealis]|uniref:Cytochrome P450 n=1 Tax=Armillaria borealis TaxID=47425 RepID=A0AA39JAN1_9AGAR|nr:cytochrome P450 [Armillaria borealis]
MDAPLLISLVLFVYLVYAYCRKQRALLPPGPPGLPFLGNALDMAVKYPWLKYAEWGRQYGDVIYLNAVGQSIIVLNSAKAVFALLDQRGGIYSDRPRLVMGGELAGYVHSVPLCPYGTRLREYRKLILEVVGPRKVQQWRPIEEEKTRIFLGALLESPEKFRDHIRHHIASITFLISHGYDVRPEDDPLVELADRGDQGFSESTTAGAFLVDSFPIMLYLPRWLGFNWMKKAEKFHRDMEELRDIPYNSVKEQVIKGTAIPSFTANLIQRYKNPSPYQEDVNKWVTTGFYSAGADTTVSSLGSFFLYMTLFPDKQKKAQEEISRVVGSARLPDFNDRESLPYVDSLLKEVHRLNPVGPLAVPHKSTKDDSYNGYLIPSGSVVLPNTWAVMHDPDTYPSPFEFLPERYLEPQNETKGINPDPRKFAFGYGRRICPGQLLADDEFYITVAAVLSVFDVLPESDKERVRLPDWSRSEGYLSSTISHPDPFNCRIVPRSRETELLIRASDPSRL